MAEEGSKMQVDYSPFRESRTGALTESEARSWLRQAFSDASARALLVCHVDCWLHSIGVLKVTRAHAVLAALVDEMKYGCVGRDVCKVGFGKYAALYLSSEEAMAAAQKLSHFSLERFSKLADEIRAGAHAAGIVHPGPNVLTLSVGISARPDSGGSEQDWLQHANSAMSRAVLNGMNQIEMAD